MYNYADPVFQTSLLKAQQEASPDGILVVSLGGQILSYNHGFVELWEISPELIGSGSDEIVLQSVISKLCDPNSFLNRVNYLYKNPFEKSFEEIDLISGRTFERYSAPVVSDQKQILGRVWFFRDITQKKTADKKLIEQQIAITSAGRLSALGQMSAEIIHEIANPLTLLDVLNSKLRKHAFQNSANQEAIINHTEKVEKSITRIAKTIKTLRALAHDPSNVELEKTSVNEIISNTLEICQPKINHSGAKMQISAIPEDLNVICNPIQISQVLLNLVINSLQAIEGLAEKWIQIEIVSNAKEIRFEIIDSGPGISLHIQEKMFSSFFTTKPAGKGTGLGLKISKSIIQAHGGSLEVNNARPNTSFVMTLPRKAS